MNTGIIIIINYYYHYSLFTTIGINNGEAISSWPAGSLHLRWEDANAGSQASRDRCVQKLRERADQAAAGGPGEPVGDTVGMPAMGSSLLLAAWGYPGAKETILGFLGCTIRDPHVKVFLGLHCRVLCEKMFLLLGLLLDN